MNRLFLIIAVIFGGASFAFAQATTMPAVQQNLKVLVIPFAPIGGTTSHEWVGAAIQENLMTDVAGNPFVWALGLDHPVGNGDVTQATAAARSTGAQLAVFGAYQYTADSQLRITGQVLDVNNARVVGSLKATGALTDLFKLEDSLSVQLQAYLPQQPNNLPTVSYGPDQSAVPVYTANATAAPDTTMPPATTYVYSQPTYVTPSYGYSYPSYGYPYYYGGGYPIIIGGGFGPIFYGPRAFVRPGFGFHGGVGFHGGGGFGFHGGGGFGHR